MITLYQKIALVLTLGAFTVSQKILPEEMQHLGKPASTEVNEMSPNCSDYSSQGFKCVAYYLCEDGKVVTDAVGLFDIRSAIPQLDPSISKCPGDIEICCQLTKSKKKKIVPTTPQTTQKPASAGITTTPVAVFVKEVSEPQIESAPDCSLLEDEGYTCVQESLCINGIITGTRSPAVLDVRGGVPPLQHKCSGESQVCCQHPESVKPIISNDIQPAVVEKPVQPKQKPTCGKRNFKGVDFGLNNQKDNATTQFGEWPNMCAIINQTLVNAEINNQYVCGCSIIAPNVVLTAAHCVKKFNITMLKVRGGEWDTQSSNEPRRHQDRQAKKVSIHPLFKDNNLHFDFALIHLETPFELDEHIGTACLPDVVHSTDSFLSKNCVATGWGKDKFGKGGNYQEILKGVELNIVPEEVCQEQLRTTRLGQDFILDKSFMCAGGRPNKDTCKGDGGGPLMCPQPIRSSEPNYVQVGIVAWGIGCGESIPGVYANVSEALCFIDWATRCVEGPEADYYKLEECSNWADREICDMKKKLEALELEKSLEAPTGDDSGEYALEGSLEYEILVFQEKIEKFEEAIQNCGTTARSVPCCELEVDTRGTSVSSTTAPKQEDYDM